MHLFLTIKSVKTAQKKQKKNYIVSSLQFPVSKKKLPDSCDHFLFGGYSQGYGVSWLPVSPSCLNRKN